MNTEPPWELLQYINLQPQELDRFGREWSFFCSVKLHISSFQTTVFMWLLEKIWRLATHEAQEDT